jgi:T4 RnlA family RNA ligase
MNTIFPSISTLEDLLPFIKDNQQIRVKQDDNGMTVVCYMIQDEDTFAGENEVMERECRGITFRQDGKIAARTLHKFFNVGEREDTQPHSLRWAKVVRIMDKRDGSMVTPVMINGMNFKCKTKKSFDTKEALLANSLAAGGERYTWIVHLLRMDLTPTFEVTSPKFPIVIKYETDELTLLHIRENVSGRYLSEDEIVGLKPPFPVVENLIEQFYGDGLPAKLVSWEKLKAAAETRTGIEGWIIQFTDGEMVKLKTKWYQELHHHVVFSRWRDVARTVLADQSDDLKGHFALVGRSIEPILKVEREIKRSIEAAKFEVEEHVKRGRLGNLTPKDMALKFKDHQLFGLIMTQFRGKEPDYTAWYVKNHLESDWGLEVVEVNL